MSPIELSWTAKNMRLNGHFSRPAQTDTYVHLLSIEHGFSFFPTNFTIILLHLIRNAADQEALEGKITYYPASRALPLSYFPYLVQPRSSFVI